MKLEPDKIALIAKRLSKLTESKWVLDQIGSGNQWIRIKLERSRRRIQFNASTDPKKRTIEIQACKIKYVETGLSSNPMDTRYQQSIAFYPYREDVSRINVDGGKHHHSIAETIQNRLLPNALVMWAEGEAQADNLKRFVERRGDIAQRFTKYCPGDNEKEALLINGEAYLFKPDRGRIKIIPNSKASEPGHASLQLVNIREDVARNVLDLVQDWLQEEEAKTRISPFPRKKKRRRKSASTNQKT